MKRSQLALAIAGLLASPFSYALVDMSDPTKTTDSTRGVSLWASELKADAQTSVLALPGNISGAGDPLDVKVPVGFLVLQGAEYYVRINLSAGATFKEHPTCTTPVAGAVCSKSLGGKGNDFVTFSLKGTSGAIGPGDTITVINSGTTGGVIGGIKVAGTASAVQMTYSLHTNKDSAESVSNPDTAKISELGPFNFIKFVPAVALNMTGGKELISDVSTEFLKFKEEANLAKDAYGMLGGFSVGAVSDTVYIPDFSVATPTQSVQATGSNLTHLLSTGMTLEVASVSPGGFSFIQDVSGGVATGGFNNAKTNGSNGGSVFLTTDTAACIAGTPVAPAPFKPNPTDANGDKVVFNLDDVRTGATAFVCVKANGVTQIAANQFSGTINPVGTDYSAPTKTTTSLNAIKQNGTVLDTPYFTSLPATQYGSRIILSNTGTAPVKYKIGIVSTEVTTVAPTAAVDGEIPANSLKRIDIKDIVALTGANNGAVRVTLTGANNWLSGVYQTIKKRTDGSTGDIQSIPLIRQGGAAAGTAP